MPVIGSKPLAPSNSVVHQPAPISPVAERPAIMQEAARMNDTNVPKSPSGYSIAVSLADVHRMHEVTKHHTIGGRLNEEKDKMFDIDGDTVTEFTCGLLEAALCCDNMRIIDKKLNDPLTGVYICKEGRWNKIGNEVELAVVSNGRAVLNTMIFKIVVEPVRMISPPPKKISFSKKKPQDVVQ
jgi:hypothetical protein